MPEAMIKTVQVKQMLANQEFETVGEAVTKVDLSRSAFYKYRDLVFAHEEGTAARLVTLSMILEHRSGVLSGVLTTVAHAGANIVTITQGIPFADAAHVTITMDLGFELSAETVVDALIHTGGVRRVDVVGYR